MIAISVIPQGGKASPRLLMTLSNQFRSYLHLFSKWMRRPGNLHEDCPQLKPYPGEALRHGVLQIMSQTKSLFDHCASKAPIAAWNDVIEKGGPAMLGQGMVTLASRFSELNGCKIACPCARTSSQNVIAEYGGYTQLIDAQSGASDM
jgi:hypothetical protein